MTTLAETVESFLTYLATLPSKGWTFKKYGSTIRGVKDDLPVPFGQDGYCPVCAVASEKGLNPKNSTYQYWEVEEALGLSYAETRQIVGAADGWRHRPETVSTRDRMLTILDLEETR